MADYQNPEDTLILETSKGDIVIEMNAEVAPLHVAQIKKLAKSGFYDGIIFHRVIDGFMAQTGCPDGTGMGGSGENIKAEFSKEKHVRGACSMARSQMPDSASSQFFICLDAATFLDGQYSYWGKVIDGMDNVDALAKGEPPRNPDVINKAYIASDA
ncbi:MAG: peptidylprolyl isomerase [Alphaproteobacteria bacterium]|nr:peptidylprolyl isomerase [Alphaproteobacteria bacterium]